ncbi:voltage-gated potassium channel [Aureococcus anophagefferens]|nr:voltage-gated potassium channel [Aureococcus anophagefferens]
MDTTDDALISTMREDRAQQRRLAGARRLTMLVGTAFGMAMLIAAGLRSREVGDATNFLSFPAYGSKSKAADVDEASPASDDAVAVAASSSSVTEVVLTYEDFIENSDVKKYLEDDKGLDLSTASVDTLLKYVPHRLVVEIDLDLIKGDYSTGEIAHVYPTYAAEDDMHFCGLKLKDSSTFVLAGNTGTSERGPKYTLDWKSGDFTLLADGTEENCHDIQWSYEGRNLWQPGSDLNVVETKVSNGDTVSSVAMAGYASDINHVGLLSQDSVTVASSRMTNAIIKAHVETSEIVWVAGGVNGTMAIETLSGETLAAGESLYYGQHNAEYFGEDEYMMFDNNYDQDAASRLLIISIDEDAETITEEWQYVFEEYPWGYSPFFGDNDRMIGGNLLGTFWPLTLSGSDYEDVRYEAKVECEDKECERSNNVGWKMYSAERFFVAPVVYNVTCGSGSLSFTTQNNFKQLNPYDGTYVLADKSSGDTVASGDLTWLPHWRATDLVGITFDSDGETSKTLTVTNQFGDETVKDITC